MNNWKLKETGTKEAVLAAAAAQVTAGTLPKEVAYAITTVVNDILVPVGFTLSVWAYGFITPGRTSIAKLDAWAVPAPIQDPVPVVPSAAPTEGPHQNVG